jgi:hypothetical protein
MKSTNRNGPYISEEFLAFVVVLIALGLRILHVIFTAADNPLAGDLTLDAAGYDRWAKVLVWGGNPVPTRIMQAPLYPWILSVLYHLFGPKLIAVRLAQAVLGAASTAFIIAITRRLFRSSAAGIIAGAAAALYLPFIFYEGVLVPATVIIVLNLLAVTLLVPERRAPGIARILAVGIVMGFSVVAKPVAVLLFPFAVLHLLLGVRDRRRERDFNGGGIGKDRTLFIKRAAVLAAGVILVIIPHTARNYRITGDFIPLTSGGGINFYIGNNPKANGFYAVPFYREKPIGGTPEEQMERMHAFAAEEAGRPLSPAEVSRFWLGKGIEYIKTHPSECAALTWRKFLFFWNRYERANVENMNFHRRFGGIIGLPLLTFGIIAPLGLLGIFMTSNRWRSLWLLYGGIIAYLVAALAFYVLARYRLPVVPFLLPFAGASVTGLLKLIRDRRFGEVVLLVAALVILFYFTNMNVAADTPAGRAGNLSRLGNAYLARGDTTSATRAYREAAEADPSNAPLRRRLELLERRGASR